MRVELLSWDVSLIRKSRARSPKPPVYRHCKKATVCKTRKRALPKC